MIDHYTNEACSRYAAMKLSSLSLYTVFFVLSDESENIFRKTGDTYYIAVGNSRLVGSYVDNVHALAACWLDYAIV